MNVIKGRVDLNNLGKNLAEIMKPSDFCVYLDVVI